MEQQLARAVQHSWRTRRLQARKQGSNTGKKDQGGRSAVTGGAQMEGFVSLVRELLIREAECPDVAVCIKKRIELPGYFRPEKQWDLLVVLDGHLLATIEFKSQIGPSFGNNYNNRTEEAIGSAADFRTAYRDGAFRPSGAPWLGYLMLLEDADGSRHPVGVVEPHFKVFPEFRESSYAKRYEILLTKLLRERLYDGACLLLSSAIDGPRGRYVEPSEELSFQGFITSLLSRVIAFMRTRG